MSAPSDHGSAPTARPGLVLNRFAAAAAERRAALPATAHTGGTLLQRARPSVLGGAQQSLNFYGPADAKTAETAETAEAADTASR